MFTAMASTMTELFEERFERGISSVLPKFGLTELKKEQKRALFHLISGRDVFVNLPTSFGKSVIYQLAPFIVEEMARLDGKMLVSLMKDQVKIYSRKA